MPFFRDKTTALAIALAVATWALCLTFPRMDGDAAVYGNLAKHMVLQDDWVNLVFRGADWLDKPHLPFWLVALSFKLFGITARAYLVPGLVFYSLGAWCTYRLARHFSDQAVAALSSVVYLSLLGLLLGVSDQKAEVYLLGLMPGATLAWLKFSAAARWRAGWHYGLLGAVLTGCCLMTKGIFVVLVVAAGVVAPLVNRRDWAGLWHWKWLVAIVGSLLCAAPELVALYLQFDARPEAAAYGHTQVSGVKFFLWDSQFGRFFNTGPIQNSGGSPFFFLHNLVWTFFPWAVVLVCAGGTAVRRLWRGHGQQSPDSGAGSLHRVRAASVRGP